MQATILQPCADLRDAVDVFWYHSGSGIPQRTISIPFLHQELVLNLGQRFTVSTQEGRTVEYDRCGTISGLYTRPVITQVEGYYEAIGVLFKPYGLYRLFGIDASLLTAGPLPLSPILKITNGFLHQVETCSSGPGKLQLVQQFLLQAAQPVPLPAAVADFHNGSLSIRKGAIKTLLQQASHKKYIRSFTKALGFTPRQYTHLRMINNAVAAIAADPEMPLTEIAYEQGFYDQAHFIRVFKTFAAMSPSAFRRAARQQRVYASFPNTMIP